MNLPYRESRRNEFARQWSRREPDRLAIAYLLQMFVRGSLGDGYPYPEVDVSRVGLGSALAFAGAVTLLFLFLGLLLIGADRVLAKRRSVQT